MEERGKLPLMVSPFRMSQPMPNPKGRWNRISFALFLLLASCLFETLEVDPGKPGYLSLEVNLKSNANALFKSASADTLFRLDSLIVILSSAGSATQTYSYAISGRSDSGNVTVTPKVFSLASLRTWKAVILSIDTTLNPARTDTVHRDSVTFTVNPGDTAFVSKTANPVYSILRARFVSNSPASLANNVKWVRIRVDGTSRDSMQIGPALRSVEFGSNTSGDAVGDSGTILKTTNSGVNWSTLVSGTTANLYAVAFPGSSVGWTAGAGGVVLKTTDNVSWTPVTSGTTQDLNALYFTGNNAGWVVGNAGVIRKTTTGTSFTAQTSGTSQNLNGIFMTSNNNGLAVGNAGTILRTTDGGTGWSAQTSGTTRDLNAVFLASSTVGYAVGDSGTILKTINSGAAWTAQTSGTARNLTGVYWTTASAGYVVGQGGTLLTTTDGGTNWIARASGTTLDLNDAGWTSNGSAGAMVGDKAGISTSTTGTAWTFRPYGTKSFDVHLTYKYFSPNVSHSLTMDAIDTLSGPLRGYQVTRSVLLAPGKDSTVTPNSSLAKCGYAGTSTCN
ncbi:MAG: Cadherin-like beta sandwich protein [Fibrobacteres bacterium]|nr:Cadherin-like beta sandwich protein [Fibrobacterota bacterium]